MLLNLMLQNSYRLIVIRVASQMPPILCSCNRPYTVKGEYLYRTLLQASGAEEVICQGFYAQGMYDLDRFYFVGRYGHVIPHDPSENDPTLEEPDPCTRITTGAGWRIQNNVQARLEYQHNSRENEDAAFLQLIVAF